MKALSIKQPWAWLIVHGHKDVENRTWALPRSFEIPQRIYVHAGLRQDYGAYDGDPAHRRLARDIRDRLRFGVSFDWDTSVLKLGAILGEVSIVDQRSVCNPFGQEDALSYSPWYEDEGDFGFQLSDAVAYDHPVPYRGRLGFFEVEFPA
jgi:hypothetical protein